MKKKTGTVPCEALRSAVASAALKDLVLKTAYHLSHITPLDGYDLLVAKYRSTGTGIFVVDGNFSRDRYKQAVCEARAAGINSFRMTVFGAFATYSGRGIDFSKFEDIGVTVEPEAQQLAVQP